MQQVIVYVLGMALCFSCSNPPKTIPQYQWYGEEVTVSAYNSVAWQTNEHPTLTAWGDTLKPGLKVVAVSRDFLEKGIQHNTMVLIDKLPDTFLVKDKMNKRWRKRIDIYMGNDVQKAREWGKRKLMICYAVPLNDSSGRKEP